MICHEYKCVFIHIPKVAGTSIEQAFLNSLGLTWEQRDELLISTNDDPAKGPPHLQHMTAEEYVKYGYLTQKQFDEYFKFTFVRDPYERIVSEYRYRRFHDQYDFKTFLLEKFPQPENDDYENYLDYYRHVVPQYDFIYDHAGNQLVDFVGRFENLQDDFNAINEKLNLNLVLPKMNKSKNKKSTLLRFKKLINKNVSYGYAHTRYYDEVTRAWVTENYQQDIKTWGYEF